MKFSLVNNDGTVPCVLFVSSILLVAPADVSEQLLKSLLLGVILVYWPVLWQFTDALRLDILLRDLLLDFILRAILVATGIVL